MRRILPSRKRKVQVTQKIRLHPAMAGKKIQEQIPERERRKIPQKAQQKIRLKKHSLPQNAPARKNAVSMQ